jgi:hypothetical protein
MTSVERDDAVIYVNYDVGPVPTSVVIELSVRQRTISAMPTAISAAIPGITGSIDRICPIGLEQASPRSPRLACALIDEPHAAQRCLVEVLRSALPGARLHGSASGCASALADDAG